MYATGASKQGPAWLRVVAVAVAVEVAGLVAPAVLWAQDDPYADLTDEEAVELNEALEAADEARDAGDFDAALAGYLRFLAQVPDEYVAIDVARCHRALGNPAAAANTYRSLLDSDDASLAQSAAEELDGILSSYPAQLRMEVRPDNAEVRGTGPDGATFTASARDSIRVRAGTWRLRVSAPGHESSETSIGVEPAESARVVIALAQQRRVAVAPIVLGVASAGAFAGAGISAARVGQLSDDFAAYPDRDDATVDGYNAIADDGRNAQRTTAILAGVGGALGVAAIITAVARKPVDERQAEGWRVTSGRAGVGIAW